METTKQTKQKYLKPESNFHLLGVGHLFQSLSDWDVHHFVISFSSWFLFNRKARVRRAKARVTASFHFRHDSRFPIWVFIRNVSHRNVNIPLLIWFHRGTQISFVSSFVQISIHFISFHFIPFHSISFSSIRSVFTISHIFVTLWIIKMIWTLLFEFGWN
jgi:hypothetical protein